MFSKEPFKEVGKKFILFLHVTSRVPSDPYQDLLKEKGGRGFPYLVWLDAKGEVVKKQEGRSTDAILKTGNELISSGQFKPKPAGPKGLEPGAPLKWQESAEKAIETAKKEKKALLIFLTDEEKDAAVTEESLGSKEAEELMKRFIVYRHVIEKDCDLCKDLKIRKGSNVVILNPDAKDPYKKPYAKISGKRNPKSLKTSLKNALKKWDKDKDK